MIAFLNGILVDKSPSRVTLDVNGVGYELLVTLNTYDRLPHTGEKCRLLVYYHVREDAQTLFGFAQAEERRMFERLIGVNGVGPKLAVSALSGMTVNELTAAIADNNVKRVSAVHGIGKKTAERIIMELRDKIDPLEALAGREPGGDSTRNAMMRDAVMALVSLGFQQDQARKMVQAAAEDNTLQDTEALLRKALASK